MKSRAMILLVAAFAAMASGQLPSTYFGLGGGGPPSSSPYSNLGSSSPPPSPYSSLGSSHTSPYSSLGSPPSSPFSRPGGGPGISPFSGRPGGFPGSKPPRSSGPSKLFSWLGSTMSKLPGLVPKIHYHSKPKPLGGPASLSGLSSSALNAPQTYFSSGSPQKHHSLILPQIPNSVFESSPSPFDGNSGSTVSFAPQNSIDHPPVHYRPHSSGFRPGAPPSATQFGYRPRPSFGSRPSISFSNLGGPSLSGSRSPFGSSADGPFGISSSPSRPYPSIRNNLEVFPSQQVSYQSQTLTQNQPGYNDALSGLQSLYGSQSGSGGLAPLSAIEQQSSYSQAHPVKTSADNYGATFHSIEPVRVAPVYDIAQHFKSSDLSGASSAPQTQQFQTENIHDTPFTSIINDYAAQVDTSVAGSEQMLNALQNPGADLMSAATSNQPIQGVQVLGSPGGFEVLSDNNSPTYDGHPVDLNKLISLIEPGATIDSLPTYLGVGATSAGSEHNPVFMQPPSSLELESEAAMSTQSGKNKDSKLVSYQHQQTYNFKDKLEAVASEYRPMIVALDGTKLNDDTLIKQHFDKDLILDDDDGLQESNDKGFIVVGLNDDDSQTGDDVDISVQGPTEDDSGKFDGDDKLSNFKSNKDLLAIIQKLRNSVTSGNNSESVDESNNKKVTNEINYATDSDFTPTAIQHPNHNYNPFPIFPEASLNDKNILSYNKTPVINPIVDSVRPGRTMSIRTSVKSSTSVAETGSSNENNDQDSSASSTYFHRQLHLIDKDIDDDEMLASASRNVKSVAIIVTPPPYYVKIKNKYKKAVTPLSALTSTTTPTSLRLREGEEHIKEVSTSNINDDAVFSESFLNANSSINIDNRESISTTTTPRNRMISSLAINRSNIGDYDDDGVGHLHDSILKLIRGISNGKNDNEEGSVSSSESESSSSVIARPRLYPVYRGKSRS